jgi:NAD(P)-dependent dehydrogenase (short-subunit alcohol dehydrogenase family)
MADSLLFFPFQFYYSQLFVTPPYPTQSFEEQICIVTGASAGLGLEAARHITRLGAAKVILAVRNLDKGAAAKATIEESTKRIGVVEVWQLDLTSFESVKEFAARARKLPRLDVLLENAGVSLFKWSMAEGHEETITCNVISTFLLGLLLLPKMKDTAQKFNVQPHLTIVSSEMHFMTLFKERKDKSGKIFEVLKDQNKTNQWDLYGISKLMEILIVRQIVEETAAQDYPVIINTINPGMCHSELMRGVGWPQYILKFLLATRTTEVGSRTLVNATIFGPESKGQYLSNCKIAHTSAFVKSEEGRKLQAQLWEELKEILEEILPGILQNI